MQRSSAPEAGTPASGAVPAPEVAAPAPVPGGLVIAVDGPSGAGKSTVARAVAARLGLRYLDTGAMYRAVTRRLLDKGVDLGDPAAIAAAVAAVQVEPGTDPRRPSVTADGIDLSEAVRAADVTAAVSTVSAVPAVRQQLVALQREVMGDGGIVIEGRDIGTTVAPSAPVKIFLTAASGARAERRSLELTSSVERSGPAPSAAETEAALRQRDALDSSRAASPLAQAPDAVVIDTTTLGVDEVVDRVLAVVRASTGAAPPAAADNPAASSLARPAGSAEQGARPRLVQPRGRRKRLLVRLGRRLGRFLMRREVLRVRVIGAEHVPLVGPAILAGNHTGFLDGPVVFAAAPRDALFLIKEEMYDGPLARVLDWMGQIPVNRGRPDRPALRRGLALLAAGEAVGMFPEGTRGAGELRNIQHGIGYLALKAGCPVVPVACFGTLDALPPEGRRIKRGTPVDVVFGEPFRVHPTGDLRTRRAVAEAAEQIRHRLAAHVTEAAVLTGRVAARGGRTAAGTDESS